jgi:transposase-like protein
MAKSKRYPLGAFMNEFSTEAKCREYMANLRWAGGFVCPKCGCRHACLLSNGRYQCADCRRQTSVTAGTVLHKSHMPLTQWFLAFYFVSQDKRGISAVQLAAMLGTTYKTAWSMLRRIRIAMGQRDETHQLCGIIAFDDAYFGGPTVGKKRGRGTEKAKVLVAVSLDERGNPLYAKMRSHKRSSGPVSKNLPRAAQFTMMVTGAISRL